MYIHFSVVISFSMFKANQASFKKHTWDGEGVHFKLFPYLWWTLQKNFLAMCHWMMLIKVVLLIKHQLRNPKIIVKHKLKCWKMLLSTEYYLKDDVQLFIVLPLHWVWSHLHYGLLGCHIYVSCVFYLTIFNYFIFLRKLNPS